VRALTAGFRVGDAELRAAVTELEAETGGSHIRELDRIAAFTDGVMAIAITLLVLNIDVPDVPKGHGSLLDNRLYDMWRDFLAYGISFAVIGRYWLIHHRFFATLERYDRRLVTQNLFFLAFLVLIPFTSDLIGTYGDISTAVIAYALVLALVAAMNWLMVSHSLRNGLVDSRRRPEVESFGGRRGLLIPGIFLASIPVAFVSPVVSQVIWLSIFLVRPRLPAHPRGAADY
jgi:uncharacterized membrane protein